MPHMTITRRSLASKCTTRPSQAPREPPSWRAAPSRPAEPPTRWVRMVATKISGAVRRRMGSASRTAMSTRLVPWSFSIPLRRYSSTMAMPPRGRKYKIQGCSPRSSAPQSIPRWKAAATAPTSRPVAPEYSSHLQKRSPSRKTLRTWFWSSVMILSPLPHRRVWVDYTTVEGKCLWEMGFLWEFLQGDFAVCGRRVTLPAAAHRRNGPGHLLLALRSNSP